jgi:hypothetical protein
MANSVHEIEALVAELEFVVVDEDTALGELHGIPTSMTVLSADPLALMFQFKVNPTGTETQPVVNLFENPPENQVSVSVEDGCAWISLYDLSGFDSASLSLLLKRIADTLHSTDLAVGPGCLRCGVVDDAQVMYVEERATRLCPGCLADVTHEQQELESQLNRGSFRATLGLPGVALFAAAGWAVFWTLLDMIMDHWRIRVVEINPFTAIAIFGLLLGVGYALGWPVGATLRRSITIGKARQATSALFVLAVAVGGEVLYVGLYLLRLAGVFDLGVAAGLLGQVVTTYSGFWILCKLGLLGAFGFFCICSASQRKTVKLDV